MPARHVANPFEYLLDRFSWAASDIRRATTSPPRRHVADRPAEVERIAVDDVWAALREGLHDLGVARTDVIFIAIFYPIAGLVLAGLLFSMNLVPMILPLVAGFALLGPVAAVGLYEVSRRLESGAPRSWSTPFEVVRSPALSSILGLGAILALIFLVWLAAAWGIYAATLGPEAPTSIGAFLSDVFRTPQGWAMILAGSAVGLLFAVVAFAIGVVSFPLLLDRDVGIAAAVGTSLRAVRANPGPMAVWAVFIGLALILGSIPALAGLIFVMPVLGHASWHLYRRVVKEA